MKTVLFVNHKEQQCGVYQYGKNTADAFMRSTKFNVVYVECTTMSELSGHVTREQPYAIIYNYHASTLGWVQQAGTADTKHLALHHEPHQPLPPWMAVVISQDPTVPEDATHFSVVRVLHSFTGTLPQNDVFTVGTFGFGLGGKGFDRLVARVCEEYDEAHIKMHIPFARFGDAGGQGARDWAARCRAAISKPNVSLTIDHDWLTLEQLLQFLADNDLNAFMYDDMGRGNSGATDFALSVPRPLAITYSTMFRHIWKQVPEVCMEPNRLVDIVARGIAPLQPLYEQWSLANLTKNYDRIIESV